MPEMPEVEALRAFLAENLVGRTVVRADLAAISALKTFAIPLSALHGMEVTGVERRGPAQAVVPEQVKGDGDPDGAGPGTATSTPVAEVRSPSGVGHDRGV